MSILDKTKGLSQKEVGEWAKNQDAAEKLSV